MTYGDVEHRTMLPCVALYIIYNARKDCIKFGMPGAYDARYFLMMLIFSIYAGFMYNDFFSVGIWLFGSRRTSTWDGKMEYFTPTYDGRNEGGDGPYPFGIDTAWHGTQNEQLYINSPKMKLSILFGVVQMRVVRPIDQIVRM